MKCALVKRNENNDWTYFLTDIKTVGNWQSMVLILTGKVAASRHLFWNSANSPLERELSFKSSCYTWKIYDTQEDCIADNFDWFL